MNLGRNSLVHRKCSTSSHDGEKIIQPHRSVSAVFNEFREKWLNICDFVQSNRGRRKVEGNADFMWSLDSEELKKQVISKLVQSSLV